MKADNPYAFPCAAGDARDGYLQEGMTLRDWYAGNFAAAFLPAAMLAAELKQQPAPLAYRVAAEQAFALANAMLSARQKESE